MTVAPVCLTCGKPVGLKRGIQLKYCSPEPSEKASRCATIEKMRRRSVVLKENPEHRRALVRAKYWRQMEKPGGRDKEKARQRRRYSAKKDDPDFKAKRKFWWDNYWKRLRADPVRLADHLARLRPRVQKALDRKPRASKGQRALATPLAGSVLAAASDRAIGREILAQLVDLVPRHYDRATREDMVCEAALLVVQGTSIEDAVVQARRAVNRDEKLLRYAKPIEDVFWL